MEHVIGDFKAGDRVYHLSQEQFTTRTEMIVTVIRFINKITCSWITERGFSQKEDFYPYELEKI
jgi:hypothetical protein